MFTITLNIVNTKKKKKKKIVGSVRCMREVDQPKMTNEEVKAKNATAVDDTASDYHENGDASADSPPKESDPLQPKMVKSKSLKEVKEVHISSHSYCFNFNVLNCFSFFFFPENFNCFCNTGTKT